MHPVNKILYQLGVMVQKTRANVLIPPAFHRAYLEGLAAVRRHARGAGAQVYIEERYEDGGHPESFIDHECAFASRHLQRIGAQRTLDVGSYRHFILGLLAHARITTIDVRPRSPISPNEEVITCDAKALALATGTFDAVVALCAIEHFGLGRYGDAFDLDADARAMREMARVLTPGGRLIFSTTITSGPPQIVFNAHRIYSYDQIQAMCDGLTLEDEVFFSHARGGPVPQRAVSGAPEVWDVYMGCWRKPS
jgi:SAM-dependent methyltransferase